MRRALALAMGLALAIAGCGGSDDDDDEGGGSAGAPETTAGFDGETIKLGVLTPLTGPVAVIGKPLTAGHEVFFKGVNAKGGIAGKYRVELVQEDTQYLPPRTVQQYNRLKSRVVAFAQVLGTAPTLATLPQLERDGGVAAPATLDAQWVAEPNLLPIGAPYQVQAINALDYWVNAEQGEDKTACAFVQDDAYGEAASAGLEYGAEQLDIEIADTQTFKVGDKDVSAQVQSLAKSDCDMVFLNATPTDAGTIWGTAARLKFAPRWIGQSPVWVTQLAQSELGDYLAETTLVVGEGTEWGDTKVPGMAKMLADVKRYKPDQQPDFYFAFGYNQARAMTALLEKAVAAGDLSHAGLERALAGLGTVDFEGLMGDYEYGTAIEERNPPRVSTIFKVNPDKPFGLETVKYNHNSPAAAEFDQFGG